jgi:L-ribulose-5-phosphate 3-epimerase
MLSSMISRHLAVCSWSLKPQRPLDLISSCNSCEIKKVQLALLPLVHDCAWENCGVLFQESGIEVISGMLEASGEDYTSLETIADTGGLRQDCMWASTEKNAVQVAEIAEQMELPLVTFHAGFIPEGQCEERTKMLKRLHILADIFAKHGVLLGLETGQECAPNVVSVLEELAHPSLGVNYDPANMILYGKGDPIEAINTLSPWVQQVHIKDAKATELLGTWGTEMPAGEGDVPWEKFLECVPSGVNLVIEREGGENRISDVQQAKIMLEKLGAC